MPQSIQSPLMCSYRRHLSPWAEFQSIFLLNASFKTSWQRKEPFSCDFTPERERERVCVRSLKSPVTRSLCLAYSSHNPPRTYESSQVDFIYWNVSGPWSYQCWWDGSDNRLSAYPYNATIAMPGHRISCEWKAIPAGRDDHDATDAGFIWQSIMQPELQQPCSWLTPQPCLNNIWHI